MVAVGMKGCDEEGRVVVEGVIVGDSEEEVFVNVLILQTPDFLTMFIDDGVLMWVVGNSGGAGWGGKEVGEEFGFWGNRKWEERENRSGWGGGGDNGDEGFNNGWQEVFYRDVGKWDALNNFLKLKVDIGVLVFRGQGVLKLRAYYISLLSSDVSEDVKKVGQGCDGGWGWGAIGIEAHGGVITTWAQVVPGVVGTIKIVLDDLVGSGDVNLVSVVDLRPVSNRKGGGDDKGG
jgi:hypothetical protein